MTLPLVSVIVLTFNGEKIIRRCLDHLLAQTYPHVEIILVDNASSDGSLGILEEYLGRGNVSVVRSKRNLGVPGGRNLGLLYAQGAIIAFMDDDGYASPVWLEEAVRTLESDGRIGAVAAMVFFNKKKIILNGAGGTLNYQGYGGDLCFNAPYEFARPPHEVLFPMGCGMVVHKHLMDRIGPLDPVPIKWYDDAELGIRLCKLGFKVVVSPNAWVDHDMGHSDEFIPNKVYLCERARIRTVLKYYPITRLPSWLIHELYSLRYLLRPSFRSIPLRAWIWNLIHLGSVLKWRFKFCSHRHSFWHLLDPSWGSYPPPIPNNQGYRPDPRQVGSRLILDGVADGQQLNFGWYFVEHDGPITYRWTEAHASAYVNLSRPIRSLSIRFRSPRAGQRISLVLRGLGEIDPTADISIDPVHFSWQRQDYPCSLRAGCYEVLLVIDGIMRDALRRTLGLAVASIEFE